MTPGPSPDAPPKPRAVWVRLGTRLRAYFIAGVLVTAPIGITLYVGWILLDFVDSKVVPLIPPRYNPDYYLPFSIPGLGLVIVVVTVTLIGMLTAGLAGRVLVRLGERIVARMPIVRGLYGASKQIIETVMGKSPTSFRAVVLIEFPRPGSWTVAFVTNTARGEIADAAGGEAVSVFVPTTPNPTSGYLVFVKREETYPLSMSVEDGIKLVVSGGIVLPPERPARTGRLGAK